MRCGECGARSEAGQRETEAQPASPHRQLVGYVVLKHMWSLRKGGLRQTVGRCPRRPRPRAKLPAAGCRSQLVQQRTKGEGGRRAVSVPVGQTEPALPDGQTGGAVAEPGNHAGHPAAAHAGGAVTSVPVGPGPGPVQLAGGIRRCGPPRSRRSQRCGGDAARGHRPETTPSTLTPVPYWRVGGHPQRPLPRVWRIRAATLSKRRPHHVHYLRFRLNAPVDDLGAATWWPVGRFPARLRPPTSLRPGGLAQS